MIVKYYVDSYNNYFNGSTLPEKVRIIHDDSSREAAKKSENIIDFTAKKYQKDYQTAKDWYVKNVSYKNPDISQAVKDNTDATEIIKALSVWTTCEKNKKNIQTHPMIKKHDVLTNIGFGRANIIEGDIGCNADCIILPMYDKSGPLSGIYCISENGATQVIGNYGSLQFFSKREIETPIHILSDWASVAKNIHLNNLDSFCITFDNKFNLYWAKAISEKFPSRGVVILEEMD